MNKKKQGKKFQRKIGPRKALLKGLARELFLRGRIKTTETKAKELKRLAEKLLTRAKKGDLAATRELTKYFDKTLVKKIINDITTKYKERPGGYTRIIKLNVRESDGARIVQIELVE